ncbi:hypothetical protein PanWU01x14_007860 [Parasponia andersonii]|uniref:Uncharacterized protein n=1 Tax=Parasponia andersonii TaxID=3476 RepID=A0A2P5E469_PARAD|nr:hypothetical protein PanWU01x14_007860 [Parasponia andersonii]
MWRRGRWVPITRWRRRRRIRSITCRKRYRIPSSVPFNRLYRNITPMGWRRRMKISRRGRGAHFNRRISLDGLASGGFSGEFFDELVGEVEFAFGFSGGFSDLITDELHG